MQRRIEEKFIVSAADIFYNPYFIIRRGLYRAMKDNAEKLSGRLLDFGCGMKPYETLFTNAAECIGVDFEGGGNTYLKTKVDVFYDGRTLPFEDAHFDSILSTEVIEHIFNSDEILSELNRVLKPGGLFLSTCPFLWPEHEQPWDFARYSSFGIKHLLQEQGFEIVQQQKTGHFVTSVIQMIVLYIYMFIPKIPVLQQILFFIFCVPFHILGLVLNTILPRRMKRKDLYLNNVVLARKPAAAIPQGSI